jgi:hypothetical protein
MACFKVLPYKITRTEFNKTSACSARRHCTSAVSGCRLSSTILPSLFCTTKFFGCGLFPRLSLARTIWEGISSRALGPTIRFWTASDSLFGNSGWSAGSSLVVLKLGSRFKCLECRSFQLRVVSCPLCGLLPPSLLLQYR